MRRRRRGGRRRQSALALTRKRRKWRRAWPMILRSKMESSHIGCKKSCLLHILQCHGRVFDQAQGQLNPLRLPNGRQDLKYHGVQGLTDHRALRFRYKGYSNLFVFTVAFLEESGYCLEDGKASRSARDITA
uniref:Uncharacterized protein n=1 Tax=Oryza glumipatula TaxID=40148 RepID=A0A0D9ZH14_9ORYZ